MDKTSVKTKSDDDLYVIATPIEKLTLLLQQQLMPDNQAPGPIIWANADAEVVVEPHKLGVALHPGLVLIELYFATDQTGSVPLVVPFRIGRLPEDATLMAVTEDLPRGNAMLASLWGHVLQETLWDAVLTIGRDRRKARASELHVDISGIFTDGKTISFMYSAPVSATDIGNYYIELEEEFGDQRPPFIPKPKKLPEKSEFWWLEEFIRLIRIDAKLRRKLLIWIKLFGLMKKLKSKYNSRKE